MEPEEVESRRRSILDATMLLFGRRSFENVGIREIAKEAGVSCGTIYRYFPSQDDLYLDALERYLTEIGETVETNFQEIRQAREAEDNTSLEKIADMVTGFLLGNPAAFRIVCHFMVTSNLSVGAVEKFDTLYRNFFHMVDQVLARAEVPSESQVYFPLFLSSLFGVVLTFQPLFGESAEEARERIRPHARLIANVYKHGGDPGA